MAQKETAERILDAAEILFAERGFAETSLRTITSAAGVNLAAVNYHFGSKKILIQAVFMRFLDPVQVEMEVRLNKLLETNPQPGVQDLLRALTQSVYEVHGKGSNRATSFMRLLGLAYTQSQAHLRGFLGDRYGAVFQCYLEYLRPALPGATAADLFWHTHFALGTAIFTMSNFDALRAMCENELGEHMSVEFIVSRLTAFMGAGLHNAAHD